MQTVYMDNASTAFPKAPGVGEAMRRYIDEVGVNVARGGYGAALSAAGETMRLRETLCRLFHAPDIEGCILTPGATYGLNMALKGCLRPGDHALVSALEHNAVMRPLSQLDNVEVEALPVGENGTLDQSALGSRIRANTRLLCVTHVSNVCGTVLPVQELGDICHRRGVRFVVDGSQSVGHVPVDCEAMHIDALIFSAHKGLLGPQGIGAALLTRGFANALSPFVTGGTGSRSDRMEQPLFLPDKLEAGTPNLPGIYGFAAAAEFYERHAEELHSREKRLVARFLDGIADAPHIRLLGLRSPEGRTGVFAIDFVRRDNAAVASALETDYGVLTRCGLHCAPSAHRALGSFPKGAVRFSLGWKTTEADVDTALGAIRELA